MEAYSAYRQAGSDMEAAREMMGDSELRELAQEEYHAAKERRERLEQELKLLLLPKDPNDGKNVVMEIRGGVGGEEAMLFAGTCCGCTPCTWRAGAGVWRSSASARRSWGREGGQPPHRGGGRLVRLKYESGTHRSSGCR